MGNLPGSGTGCFWKKIGSNSMSFEDWQAKKEEFSNRKRYREVEGDLFALEPQYSLAHCVAEDLHMGAGIAVAFRRKFGRVRELKQQDQKKGGLAVLAEDEGDTTRYIYYLVTKEWSIGKPTYQTLFSSLVRLKEHVRSSGVKKLAMPKIGCGLDRLDWASVGSMINYVFQDEAFDDVDIVVCIYSPPERSARERGLFYRKRFGYTYSSSQQYYGRYHPY